MARTRADLMADHLEQLLRQGGGAVEIQRGALAARFGCAPSQVNYVLATRFTLAHGYVLESRPGAKGYIRIRFLEDGEWARQAARILRDEMSGEPTGIDQETALRLIAAMRQMGLVTGREEALLVALTDRDVLQIALPERDRLRVRLVQAALRALDLTAGQPARRDGDGV